MNALNPLREPLINAALPTSMAMGKSPPRPPSHETSCSICARALTLDVMDATPPTRLLVRPMNVDDASRVAGWRYRERWSVYDLESAAGLLDELDLYWAVTDSDDALVGFVCVEAAARVPGLDEGPPFLDVGVGLNPDLAGQGRSLLFGQAVLGHLVRQYPVRPLRAVIQAWNVRSLRFAGRCGFIDGGEVMSARDRRPVLYRVMVKPAGPGLTE
jgi:RimJ/RimL family protein N-acetyltransferase